MAGVLSTLLREQRFVFVMGKGGVGRTTASCALALHIADHEHPTHLLSTDPAHSLGDVLDEPVGPAPTPSHCNPALQLEAFDAHAFAKRWDARYRSALQRVIERGTYLHEDDVAGLLALDLPGVHELMSALRLVELSRHLPAGSTVIVDAPPTGHALRMLSAGEILASWVSALRAMAQKADTVASSLLGATVRLPEEAVLDEMDGDIRSFETILANAAFVVLERTGGPVQMETRRLLSVLRERGFAVTARIGIGAPPSTEIATVGAPWTGWVPARDAVRGCNALREWTNALRAVAAHDSPESTKSPTPTVWQPRARRDFDAPGWLNGLPQRFLLFAGRGGVGKTTCASATALALSDQRAVLLIDADPAGSVGDVLSIAMGPGGATLGPRMRVQEVRADREFQALRDRHREAIARVFDATGLGSATLDRRVHERLLDLTPPGIDEVAALAVLTDALEGEETLVVDAAPSGHFLQLIRTPELALEWVHALLRILRRERGPAIVSALEDLLQLAGRIRRLHAVLTDPAQSGVLLITTAEPVVQRGTERLGEALDAAGIHRIATLINRSGPGCQALTGRLSGTTLCAPSWPESPVGEAALRQFLGQWECAA